MNAPADLRQVVLPVDGSPESVRALPLAARFGSLFEIPVVVVSVVEDLRREGAERIGELEKLLADLPDHIERKIVQAGAPARAIAEESADALVCMATSARLFDDEGIRGSVAEFVTASARGPVVVLGPEGETEPTIDRVVVGIDPSHDQRALTAWATRIAYHAGWPVDYVHVDPGGASPVALGPKVRRIEAVGPRSVASLLDDEAEGALLAIGSHGRTGFDRLLDGSVGGKLFTLTAQPVMVLGPQAEA